MWEKSIDKDGKVCYNGSISNKGIDMNIYELMREIGEDTPEQDLVTDDLLAECGLDAEDFSY